MDDFGFSPTDDTSADLGNAFDPGTSAEEDTTPLGCDGGGDYDPSWAQGAIFGYLDGVGSFEAIDYDLDGKMDVLAVDIDSDGSPDVLVTNNFNGTYDVQVDIDGDGIFDQTVTMTENEMAAQLPELWNIIDHYEWTDAGHEHHHHDGGHHHHEGHWTHTVEPGDSLWKIAEDHLGDGSRWPEIYALNPWIEDPNLIYPGQELAMPDAHGHHHDGGHHEGHWTHTVEPGDSLWKIAEDHLGDGSRWPEIHALNPWIDDPNLIYPGQELVMPDAHGHGHDHGQSSGHHEHHHTHTVEPGDSLWKIAAEELGDGSRWPEIHALNPWIEDPNLIYPGQELVLPHHH
ncbi:MAG: LysM peptidoglycan-binding domain-containing protein [Micrococcales bacterium]|nr:LysM peptidoglycan-binding domain-containing protein [Micrococcales bacterium]MCL2666957.1 LysM peptidoglycan-binding domain-containing protein [Micrococcales bacterium]